MRDSRFVLTVIAVIGAAAFSAAVLEADEPTDRPFWRPVVMGEFGMVAAERPLEARAAMKALEQEGNAIDAAVAASYMSGMVEQHQAGMGGDGFLLAYIAGEKRVVFFNRARTGNDEN